MNQFSSRSNRICPGILVWISLALEILLGLEALNFKKGLADEYHYKNLLVGERASGLGGSYAAISDDPSGIFYNPAGIVFSLDKYFSLSANAYVVSDQTFKNTLAGQDYLYHSQSLIPAFFGFTQSFGSNKFGFAVIVPNSDLIDQDDSISGVSSLTGKPSVFKRRLFQQDTTFLVGPAFARELSHNFTIGMSLLGLFRTYKVIDNQLVLYNPVGTSGTWFLQNSSISTSEFAVLPKIGVQYMPHPKVALGMTVSKPFNILGSGSLKSLVTNTDSQGNPVPYTGTQSNDISLQTSNDVFHNILAPWNITVAGAYFFSKSFLASADLDAYSPDNSYLNRATTSVFNWSVGAEKYLSDSFAFRLGAFSNNSNATDINPSQMNQAPKVDMIGASLGASIFKPGSSLTLSTSYSYGKGQGQVFSGSTLVQDVIQTNLAVYLTGSYQL